MMSPVAQGRGGTIVRALTLAALLPIGFAGDQSAQVAPAGDEQSREAYRLSVNVDLVVLNAAVRDHKGRFVSDLREQDFEIYEDGVRQSVRLFRHEDIPVTVGLVVDHSGSMRHKLADVVAAARTFIESSSREDEMFVVNFNENVTVGLPPGVKFTDRTDDLARAISDEPPRGQTALYDAIVKAQEQLRAGSRNKKALIVVSDGGDNASRHRLAEVLKLAEQSSALIYTIGIYDEDDPDRNPRVLKHLADATGGEAFFPDERNDVTAACERIAHDIRHQYTLGYVSANTAKTGGYRAIRVVAHAPGKGKLSVRTRSGYIAGGEPRPVTESISK